MHLHFRGVKSILQYGNRALTSFNNSLTTSLVPNSSSGGVTPTFTRTTTATVTDFEGLIKTAKIGEVRFQGARRVENLILGSSEDLNISPWAKSAGGTGSNPTVTSNAIANPIDGLVTASQVRLNRGAGNTSSDLSLLAQSTTTTNGLCSGSFWIKGTNGEQVAFRHVGAGGYTVITFTGSWQRISVNETYATNTFQLVSRGTISTTNDVTFYIFACQLERVAGQTNQNPSEYVSIGVPVGLIDGELVTNGTFDSDTGWTKEGGWTIASGKATYDGSLTASRIYQTIPAILGRNYFLTFDVLTNSGVGANTIFFGATTLNTAHLPVGRYNFFVSSPSTNPQLSLYGRIGEVLELDNITVKETMVHGAYIDGVKYFNYQNGNTVASNIVTEATGAIISNTILDGYLSEPVIANLILQSEDASTTWTKEVGTTLATNQISAPNGTTTADSITEVAGSNLRYGLFQAYAGASATYTFSFFVKQKSGSNWVRICMTTSSSTSFAYMTVDVVNGTITQAATTSGTPTNVSGYVETYPNDWYKICLTATLAIAYVVVISAGSATPAAGVDFGFVSYTGSTSNAFYLWGMQLEASSFCTSYIATTTASVTRNADILAYAVSGNLNTSDGAISLTFTPNHNAVGTIFLWGTYVNASNYTALLNDATNMIFRKRISGVNYDATISNGFVKDTTYKVACSWSRLGTYIAIDGIAGTANTNATTPQMGSTFQIGADGNSLQQPTAGIDNFKTYKNSLSIYELINVTQNPSIFYLLDESGNNLALENGDQLIL